MRARRPARDLYLTPRNADTSMEAIAQEAKEGPKAMRVVVTGGTGFLGTRLIAKLAERGHTEGRDVR
jgi:FlaA1/EpsC-like NDP-sugar epimerase